MQGLHFPPLRDSNRVPKDHMLWMPLYQPENQKLALKNKKG